MGTQTLIQICNRLGSLESLPQFSAIYGNPDPTARLLLECAQLVGEDLCSRFSFDWNTKWINGTVAAPGGTPKLVQLKAMMGGSSDFDPKVFPQDCFWNITTRIPFVGPLSIQQRQELRIFPPGGNVFLYWIEDGYIVTTPPVPVNHQWTLYARSNQFVDDGSSGLKSMWNADTNKMACSDGLFIAGMELKWRERNSFPYDQAFTNFERKANQEAATTGGAGMTLSMDSRRSSTSPGIVVVGIPVPL